MLAICGWVEEPVRHGNDFEHADGEQEAGQRIYTGSCIKRSAQHIVVPFKPLGVALACPLLRQPGSDKARRNDLSRLVSVTPVRSVWA